MVFQDGSLTTSSNLSEYNGATEVVFSAQFNTSDMGTGISGSDLWSIEVFASNDDFLSSTSEEYNDTGVISPFQVPGNYTV